jgi:sugar phosphate isomerase/epimerase
MRLFPSFLAAIVLCLSPKALPSTAAEPAAKLDNAFFAFDNGTGRGKLPLAEQAGMLEELGYAGIGFTGTSQIPEMLEALDARGLKMFSTYVGLRLDGDAMGYDAGLPKAIEQLKGRGTALWLFVTGKGPATTERDAAAVKYIREIAELAKVAELKVVLYPHHGFYVATVEDALRLAEQADRDNVGVSFNLCHWLREGDARTELEPLLKRAMPKLWLVSINGADKVGPGWDRLIQTLDRGDYDVCESLITMRRLGYSGPVGLQCYNVPGDVRENLAASMAQWRKFQARTQQ